MEWVAGHPNMCCEVDNLDRIVKRYKVITLCGSTRFKEDFEFRISK